MNDPIFSQKQPASPLGSSASASVLSLDGGATPLDGSWEQKGRTPVSAAIVALLGIGFFYFNGQTILTILAIFSPFGSLEPAIHGETFSERLTDAVRLNANPIRTAVLLSQYLFMLVPVWLVVRSWHSSTVERYMRLRGASALEVLLGVLLTLAFLPVGTFIASETSRFMDAPEWLEQTTAVLFTANSPGEFIWLVFVVAVTPAICEEIFFRGFIQRTMERTLGWKSVILVGVIFGLFHMQPLGLVTLAIFGILLGYLYYRSRSLLPAMAAHFTNNFAAILVLYLHPTVGGVDLSTSDPIPIAWVLGSLPVIAVLLLVYNRLTAPADDRQRDAG